MSFDDPIPLPGGGQLVTLKDAAEYILALPAKTSAQEHWHLAMQMLIDAADHGGIVMLARIAVQQAYRMSRRAGSRPKLIGSSGNIGSSGPSRPCGRTCE
jgi:hypothetical protein